MNNDNVNSIVLNNHIKRRKKNMWDEVIKKDSFCHLKIKILSLK